MIDISNHEKYTVLNYVKGPLDQIKNGKKFEIS